MKLSAMKQAVVGALEDIKARDIKVYDVKHLTPLFDCVVIASADSTRQTKALANNVQLKLKQCGATVYGLEGEQSGLGADRFGGYRGARDAAGGARIL